MVGEAPEPLEELQCLLVPAEQLVAVGEPERTGQEDALPRRPDVDGLLMRAITEDEAVLHQLPLDRFDRASDAWIGRGQEADERKQEEGRVEVARPVRLRKGAELLVVAALADLLVDLVSQSAPAIDGPVESLFLDAPHRAIEGHPRPRLRVHEVAALAADFPDALVGLVPGLLEVVEH